MPLQYETNIGDNGVKLSGGEQQRLSIARAIYKNAPILILDEATSHLDSNSEKLVQDALQNLLKDKTAIIIAHRLSTVQFADEIIVLKEGEHAGKRHASAIDAAKRRIQETGGFATTCKVEFVRITRLFRLMRLH
jgi:ABC-type multidrug transport system fused ATPase/permease subunit